MNKVIAGHTVPPNEQKSEGSQTEEWNKQPFFFSLDLDSNYYVYILMSYHVIQQYICCFGSAFGLNQRRRKKNQVKENKTKTPGVSSENPAPAQVGSVLSPSTISGEVWSVTTQGSKRLNSFRQLEAQYTGSRFSHISGRRCRQVRYSTSLGLSVLSFLMTGRGWASVLKTQCSNGRWSSSEKRR